MNKAGGNVYEENCTGLQIGCSIWNGRKHLTDRNEKSKSYRKWL